MRIVIIQRGSGDPYNTHTYFIDDRKTVETLDDLLKRIQEYDSLPQTLKIIEKDK